MHRFIETSATTRKPNQQVFVKIFQVLVVCWIKAESRTLLCPRNESWTEDVLKLKRVRIKEGHTNQGWNGMDYGSKEKVWLGYRLRLALKFKLFPQSCPSSFIEWCWCVPGWIAWLDGMENSSRWRKFNSILSILLYSRSDPDYGWAHLKKDSSFHFPLFLWITPGQPSDGFPLLLSLVWSQWWCMARVKWWHIGSQLSLCILIRYAYVWEVRVI